MDDTDIRGMTSEQAKAYALEFITTLKSLDRELASVKEECALWTRRIELAVSKGATELEAGARAKLEELTSKMSSIQEERNDIAFKADRIKEKLPMAGMSERSVDTDLLLANLRTAAGLDPDDRQDPATNLDKELGSLGVDDKLAALKAKMKNN